MKLNTSQAIYLAALLHDIGKFWQRASKSRMALKESTLQMTGSICPQNSSGYDTHLHALFTHEFFETHRSVFPGDFLHQGKEVQLGFLSARHHKQNLGPLERIIKFADILSSGHDRREEVEDIANDTTYKYKKIPLLNPFDRVYTMKPDSERSYFPLLPLSAEPNRFASTDATLDRDRMDEYQALWIDFEKEISHLPKSDFSALSTSLLMLLKKYTWCIPSATNTMPDISLYDHLKTTAAIAAVLYESEQLDEFGLLPETKEGLQQEEKERFALLIGDFSGIQKFIYQLSSKAASKTLKGRSFYLNLLQDAVVGHILTIFGLEKAHLLMASGGRFQLLLPNNREKLKEVEEFIAGVNSELRDDFGGAIYLASGVKAFPASSFMSSAAADSLGYPEIVKSAYNEAERDKSRKFAASITPAFFEPEQAAGTKADQVCHVTGEDLTDSQAFKLDDDTVVSRRVHEQIRLGRWLKKTSHILKIRKPKGKLGDREITPLQHSLPKEERVTYRFIEKGELDRDSFKRLLTKEHLLEVISLNDTAFMDLSFNESAAAHSFIFYGAGWVPDEVIDENGKERPVEFTDIAEDGVNNLMAVLRMDVDNLGELFSKGFQLKDGAGIPLASISRYTSVSEKLDLFFSGFIHHLFSEILKEDSSLDEILTTKPLGQKRPQDFILPVYAGGDDLFVICRWDLAPQIATIITNEFQRFTNKHPNITLSGGVSVVHGKYPIHKAAQLAQDAEQSAKALPDSDGNPDGKDAFSLFGQSMGWKDFNLAKKYVSDLVGIQQRMNSRSLLGFLRHLYGEYDEREHYGRWRWRSAYRLKRMSLQYKQQEDEIIGIAGGLFNGTYQKESFNRVEILNSKADNKNQRKPQLVDLTGFAVRWVQSLTRNKT